MERDLRIGSEIRYQSLVEQGARALQVTRRGARVESLVQTYPIGGHNLIFGYVLHDPARR